MGTERVIRYAFRAGQETGRRGNICHVHHQPACFWTRCSGKKGPDIESEQIFVDAVGAIRTHPHRFSVVVGSNLFGDILTDLGAAIAGTIGIAASANLNPERAFPSMFEPVHGSAPDIAGKGIANPLGQIWSGALMLDHLGYPKLAQRVVSAMSATLEQGIKTPDLGGTANTAQVTEAVAAALTRA
jgi:tartrate dehydrogenase/decarboxylase/D-malate dehydrogenase